MRAKFFSKCSKIDVNFTNGAENLGKGFSFLDNPFELVAVNSHYYKENTCNQQSVC